MPPVLELGLSAKMWGFCMHLTTWCCILAIGTSSTTNQEVARETNPEPPLATVASPAKDSRGLFSPRMDYDEWTPLGRGDPLKNDPTYVYVPPVLERVHYWVDPSSKTPDPPLPGSMALGQSSLERNTRPHEVPILRTTHKKPAPTVTTIEKDHHPDLPAETRRDPYDPFLKFIDGPKFSSTPQHHYYHRPSNSNLQSQRIQYMLQHQYYPSMYHHKQRPNFEIQQSFASGLHSGEQFPQREPYTMLVPPPLQVAPTFSAEPTTTTTERSSTPAATSTTVDVGKGSLLYHTSTVPDWVEGKTQLATLAVSSNQVTWIVPSVNQTVRTSLEKHRKPTSTTERTSTQGISVNTSETKFVANNIPPLMNDMGPLLASLLKEESWATTTTRTTTASPTLVTMTTNPSLTTDPLFSHYKQPAEPMRGPMYLIIQGHSKVKTYGAVNPQSFHGIPVQENNEISQGNDDPERNGRGVEDEYEFTTKTTESVDRQKSTQSRNEFKRNKRQIELIGDLLPLEDAAYLLENYLVHESDGSGFGALIASSFTGRTSKRTL